jgi:hypothetical protein
MTITSAELLAARTRLGLSPKEFASELGMPVDWYVDFEAGRAKLPRKEAEWVTYRLACAERDDALAKSGLPTCSWIHEWIRELPPSDAKLQKRVAYFERGDLHAKSCPTCLAREQFVREHFPNLPKPPVAGWMRVFGAITNWIQARPEWLRPALYGAVILAAMTMVRVPFLLLRGLRQPGLLLVALGALAAASVAGAGGGLIYYFLGRPARRLPVVGPYLAGIVAVAGYMGCIVAIMTIGGAKDVTISSLADAIIFGAITVFFGLIVGHMWFRPKKLEA